MTTKSIRTKLKKIPSEPGVYRFYDAADQILYVGKARNLRHRVPSYFLRSNLDRGPRIASLVDHIVDIDWTVTDSEIEALLLEARLIQKYKPKYNIEWRDDKSYLHVVIDTKAPFPQIKLVRRADVGKNKRARYFGPYTSPRALKIALRFIRKILPYCEYSFSRGAKARSVSDRLKGEWFASPCLYYHLGLCPGVCAGAMSVDDYRKRVRQLIYFFEGRKEKVIRELEREMKRLSGEHRYEEAARVRDSWEALYHLKDISLIAGAFEEKTMARRGAVPHRIEAYDVSNIFGNFAVGAMVVFTDGEPDKNEYKRFKINTVPGISDVGALVEVLRRRMEHSHLSKATDSREPWTLPDLIIIDGGKGQLNAAVKVLTEFGAQIPILAVAKGRERKRADQYYYGPGGFGNENLIRRVRDEAHRFAISYYRTLHRKGLLQKRISQ